MEDLTSFDMVMDKMFGIYFIQIITILILLFMIFSGKLNKLWDWVFSFRKVKVGNKFEMEQGGTPIPNDNLNIKNKDSCLTTSCLRYEGLKNSIEERNADITLVKERIKKVEEHQASKMLHVMRVIILIFIKQ